MSSTNETRDPVGPSAAQLMTDEFADCVLAVTILNGITIVLGFFGNLGVFTVYKTRYPRCNFKYFVLFLSGIDLLGCVVILPGEMYVHRNFFTLPDGAAWFCKLKNYFTGVTVLASSMFLLLIAVDRFRKVCRPLKWQIKPKMALKLCALICVIDLLLAIPAPILWGKETQSVEYLDQNITVAMCGTDNAYKNTHWPSVYLYVFFCAPIITFMAVTCVLYVMIMRVVLFGSLAWKNIPIIPTDKHESFRMTNTQSTITDDDMELQNSTDDSLEDTLAATEGDSDGEQDSTPKSKFQAKRKKKIQKIINTKMRLRRKTMILFVLTTVFIVTTLVYFGLLGVVRIEDKFISNSQEEIAVMLFFWRIYFFNHIVNPLVYGCMDTRFRATVEMLRSKHK